MAKATWVAVCSGNHDYAGRQISAVQAPVYEWLVAFGREPRLITDGTTHVLDDLIIATLPYHFPKVWLDRGAVIRRQHGGPWLVLRHIPPIVYPWSTEEEAEAAELLQIYRPEYFMSGHSHQFPYFPGGSWAQIVNGVNMLVPGQLLSAPFPNHIVLNTESEESEAGNVESVDL